MRKAILTGPAYAGKTSLLKELERRGYQTVPEVETQIVGELVRKLGPENTGNYIRANYFDFKRTVGEKVLSLEASLRVNDDVPVFFDRGAICYIAYCKLRNSPVPEVLTTLAQKEKADWVFFVEGLSSFNERRETGRIMKKEEAERLAVLVREEYRSRGFKLVDVLEFFPSEGQNIDVRANYIIDFVQNR